MNLTLFSVLFVLFLGCVQATKSVNPECTDLDRLQKNLEKAVKNIPGTNYANCKPNKNCTGLECSGQIKGKEFHGTIVLEGCHEPVRMVINMNNRHINVANGFQRQVLRTPPVYVTTGLKKEGSSVFVTVKIKICLSIQCLQYPILRQQKIRVHCNGSTPTMLPSQYPWPSAQKSKNPECKGLVNTKNQVEHHFGLVSKIFPGSKPKISCKPASNCSELTCSGEANKDHFNATATVDYCSHPVKLRLKIDVPNQKLHIDHRFKDGEKYRILRFPPIYIKVNLKRVGNIILFTVSIPFLGKPYYLVKNMSITVDPSHCPGYHGRTTMPPREILKCEKMDAVAKMVEQKLSSKRKGSSQNSVMVTRCDVVNKCSGLRCTGRQGNKDFQFDSSVNYCTSSPTLDFALVGKGKPKFHFKNGKNNLYGQPLMLQMKKTKDIIFVNVSLSGLPVLENAEIPCDPHDCPASAKSSGLSPGAIGGVVVAGIIFIALLIAIIVWIVRGKRQRIARYNDLAMSDDSNPLFFNSEPAMA